VHAEGPAHHEHTELWLRPCANVYKSTHGTAPQSLSDVCIPVTEVVGRQHFYFASCAQLHMPRFSRTKFGDCLFLFVSAVWTQLETKQEFCLVFTQFRWVLSCLNPVSNFQVFSNRQLCSQRRHGQDKTVLSCPRRWCEQAGRHVTLIFTSLRETHYVSKLCLPRLKLS